MCGRFAMDTKTDELVREFVGQGGNPEDWWKSWHGSYSIAPTDYAPIVRDRGEGRILEFVRWDWRKPANRLKGAPIINARIEKLATGFWAPAFTAARCVVPTRQKFGHLWRPAAKTAGLTTETGTGMHALRHYYASLLIRYGESVKTVQSRLGHKSATETLDTYGHMWADSDDRTRDAIDSVLGASAVSLRTKKPV
ncbi:SOS response-associated peptidase family protein [Microbacterium sp. OR21]|uniref:SOS response-associated peptidase family protein n=1 Tax=Microbacterium sp. OR21 TaxID=3095346 RepID=UPI0039B61DED